MTVRELMSKILEYDNPQVRIEGSNIFEQYDIDFIKLTDFGIKLYGEKNLYDAVNSSLLISLLSFEDLNSSVYIEINDKTYEIDRVEEFDNTDNFTSSIVLITGEEV